MVLHKHGERLYTGLKKVVTEHLEQKVSASYSTYTVCRRFVYYYALLIRMIFNKMLNNVKKRILY